MWSLLIFLVAFSVTEVLGEHILIFHHVASYSHRVQTMPLAEALSKRGHQVTFLSPFYPKEPNPNITEIIPQKLEKYIDETLNREFDINLRVQNKMEQLSAIAYELGKDACEALYKSPEFKRWLKKTNKVDLLIIDSCLPECGIGLAYKLGAKYAIFNTVTIVGHEYDAFGFLPESSAVPELEINSPKPPMNFLGRVSNELVTLGWRWSHFQYSKIMDSMIRKSLLVPEMPYIEDLYRNVSLILHTGDAVTDYPRTLPPLYVNVAGIHCKSSEKISLPVNLELFLNTTVKGHKDDGFVYISLGSLVVSSNLPQNIKNRFFDTIKSFPNLKFLWKWNGVQPKDIPSNLFLSQWFPQLDILGACVPSFFSTTFKILLSHLDNDKFNVKFIWLISAHPRIRGFITQSGRPSAMEALYNGVPMISFPILGDQDFNSHRINKMGGNVELEIGSFTSEELISAVTTLVYEPSMKLQMKRLQNIFRDRPMTPVDTAVWWTEYVLRTEDTSHLRPTGNDQYWFQRRQLDVWLFLLAVMLVATYVLTVLSILAARMMWKQMNTSSKLKLA
ncbi:unnamed protein product [Orchesella dallaii]|uniref:Uncharacterized protein n=1 Tax=Orchesella dallaii TaxID=48710 RepID=A0ABP1QF08_9HEXA